MASYSAHDWAVTWARAQALSAMRKLYRSRRNTERPGAATIWVVWCSQVLLPPNPWTIVDGDIRESSRHLPTITISGSAQPSPLVVTSNRWAASGGG